MGKKAKAVVVTDFLQHIKKLGGRTNKAGRLNLPGSLGTGYLQRIQLSPDLGIMLQQFVLHERMIVKRAEKPGKEDMLIFSFRNVLPDKQGMAGKPDARLLSSVQVSTFDVGVDLDIPAHTAINNLVIGIHSDLLNELMAGAANHKLVTQLTNGQQPYLCEAIISPQIQAVAAAVFQADAAGTLAHYFYRVKAGELIYWFLVELLKREAVPAYPLNYEDINRVYAIRNAIINNLDVLPRLAVLAKGANMSVTKMGRLFRQIFGDSIYNYYQKIRMQHAAALLREKGLSVSEVGYGLGFSNLSHFARLFEKLIGTKPKQYSKGG